MNINGRNGRKDIRAKRRSHASRSHASRFTFSFTLDCGCPTSPARLGLKTNYEKPGILYPTQILQQIGSRRLAKLFDAFGDDLKAASILLPSPETENGSYFDSLAPELESSALPDRLRAALFTLEARYRRYDGEYRWIRSVSQPRLDPEGEFAGFIGVGYDITDAKRAEADLKR